MKIACLSLAATLTALGATTPVQAQTVPGTAASVPSANVPNPRLMTPEQKRDSGSPPLPSDAQPDQPVTPQIKIPLARKPAPPGDRKPNARRSDLPASAGRVDDAVARCDAAVDKSARESCREALARAPKRR